MAILGTSWSLLGQKYVGKSGGNLYVRIYARCTQQDISNNRSWVEYNASTYYENSTYIKDNQGAIGCSGTGVSWGQVACTYVTRGENSWTTRGGWAYHNTDGTLDISATAILHFPNFGWKTEITGYATLPQIPRQANILSAQNFTDEENPTITFENQAGAVVTNLEACISFDGSRDDVKYRAVDKNAGRYTFDLTEAERQILRGNCVGRSYCSVKFYLRSTINGLHYHSTANRTFTIVNGSPVVNVFAEETNPIHIKLTGNKLKLIKGQNDIHAWMSAETRKGATLNRQSISCSGLGTNGADAKIKNAIGNVIDFAVEDNRGNVVNKQIVLDMIDYFTPTCVAHVEKPTANGDMLIKVNGKFFNDNFGAEQNVLHLQYRIKENDGSYAAWQRMQLNAIGNEYEAMVTVSKLDYRNSYTVQVKAEDKLAFSETKPETVKTIPIFDWSKNDFNFNVPIKINGDLVLEKGTWIPTAKSNVIINSYSECEYYRVGELVFIKGCINVQNGGEQSSANVITGLPFVAAVDKQHLGITYTNHISYQGANYALETKGSDLQFVYWSSQRTWDLDRCLGDNPGTLYFSGVYIREGVMNKNEHIGI